MSLSIQRVGLDEVGILSAMAKQTFYDTFTGTCTEEDMHNFLNKYFSIEALREEIKMEDDFCYIARVNDIPAGYLRFKEDYSGLPLMKKWKALELKRIYILKEFQGKGVAQALIDFFHDYANKHQYEAVWLGVWEHNYRAQKFYAKYGFENSGHTHDFPIGNTPQTDIWMWKFLK